MYNLLKKNIIIANILYFENAVTKSQLIIKSLDSEFIPLEYS